MPLQPALIERLVQAGEDLWRRHRQRRNDAFHGFVPADYHGAYRLLDSLRDRADSFVELGSGAGVITILADLLGYEACGVEIEPWLVESARELAERFESEASFIEGSFLPRGWLSRVDADFAVTYDGAPSAWDELGLDLADFDVVYAFPWPGEEQLFHDLVHEYARPDALFVTYGSDEGFVVHRA